MAKRPTKKTSDMYEDPVLETVAESQCFRCVHNKGLKCEVHGSKPMKYMDALSKEKCPDREEK